MSLLSRRGRGRRLAALHRLLYSETGTWGELDHATRLAAERRWLERVSRPPAAAAGAPRHYVLAMFPYPSGSLHMGHVRVYAISDAVARFHRLQGKQVLHPMGWDAFGLPAENAARRHALPADAWTRANISHMRAQLRRMACCFDWRRELTTCQPEYYRWTQWLFLQLQRAGLVCRRQAMVNWDPVDGTVLADEQVDGEGRSWRSGALVERRLLRQWFIRTTRFAERLAKSLDTAELQGWRDVILMQKHWIGDCDGWRFELEVEAAGSAERPPDPLLLWTAEPRRFLDADFIGVRGDHPLAAAGAAVAAHNPATGGRLPVAAHDALPFPDGADAVLCAAADGDLQRALWQGLAEGGRDRGSASDVSCHRESDASENATDRSHSERPSERRMSSEEIVSAGGGYRCSSRLQDWLISRQRYWGTPIPIVHCERCGAVPVPEGELPVRLPAVDAGVEGRSPLQDAADWLHTKCPRCGGAAVRETDTMDTFVDSSWYFLRYLDPDNCRAAFEPAEAAKYMPVDVYVGGKEHAVLHLYYARFVHHFLHSLGLVRCQEPFARLIVQGQVMGQSFQDSRTGRYVSSSQVEMTESGPVCAETRRPLTAQWEKMSKSKLNGVDPTTVVDEMGADTMRLIMLATVAPTSPRHWSEETFPPLLAWQRRLWMTVGEFVDRDASSTPPPPPPSAAELRELEVQTRERRNFFVGQVTLHFQETHQLSSAVHRLQGLTAALRRTPDWYRAVGAEYQRALGDLIIMTSPIMPCMTSEMWAAFSKHARSATPWHDTGLDVLEQRWPAVDQDALLDLSVQINGMESAVLQLPRRQLDQLSASRALQLARADAAVRRFTSGGVSSCALQLLPGLQATLRLEARTDRAQQQDRAEVLRLREERKRAKKEKRRARAERKAARDG